MSSLFQYLSLFCCLCSLCIFLSSLRMIIFARFPSLQHLFLLFSWSLYKQWLDLGDLPVLILVSILIGNTVYLQMLRRYSSRGLDGVAIQRKTTVGSASSCDIKLNVSLFSHLYCLTIRSARMEHRIIDRYSSFPWFSHYIRSSFWNRMLKTAKRIMSLQTNPALFLKCGLFGSCSLRHRSLDREGVWIGIRKLLIKSSHRYMFARLKSRPLTVLSGARSHAATRYHWISPSYSVRFQFMLFETQNIESRTN